MNKTTKRMIVLAFAIIGLVWTLTFVTNTVVIPVGKAMFGQMEKAADLEFCKNNRNPHNESIEKCMDKMGH